MNKYLVPVLSISLGLVLVAVGNMTPSTDITKSTVMITNLASNSGGSGTILSSSPGSSQILTNSHVCEVVKNGGYVHSHLGNSFVHSFKQSENHDLCLITVLDNLEVNTSISSTRPKEMSSAVVSGHPHLLPTIITKGHFSGRKTVPVMTKMRDCKAEDMEDPESAFICIFLGKLPVIRVYESVVVSPTIQPGSSGSGVYTENNEIGAVIFAGAGDFGYGLAVPYEYVRKFVTDEVKKLDEQFPSLELDFRGRSVSKKDKQQLKQICETVDVLGIKGSICKHFNNAVYLE